MKKMSLSRRFLVPVITMTAAVILMLKKRRRGE